MIVLEAARAINSVPVPEALPDLARLLSRSSRGNEAPITLRASRITDNQSLATSASATHSFILRRALNANFRLGQRENASALASFAANDSFPETLRVEALELLSLWAKPPARDRVVGLYRPLPPRDRTVAAHELDSVLAKIEANAPSMVKVAAKKAAATLAGETTTGVSTEEFAKLSRALENGSTPEKQSALATLASVNDDRAAKLLSAWVDRLFAGEIPKELRLDVLEAARSSQILLPATREKL